MPRNHGTTVIDFGSSTINVMIAERGSNNTFHILGQSVMEYSGFLNGEFLDEANMFDALKFAIESAESQAGMKISEVYVGVPGEFTAVIVNEPALSFQNKRRITNIETEELYKLGNNFQNNPNYLLISQSPIYYTIDNGSKLIDAFDAKTTKLSGQLSYILAMRKFTDFITNVLRQFEINEIEFVSQCLAESTYLISSNERDRYAILVDVGYTTSSIMLIRGEGLLYLKSFPVGGGHISGDLNDSFKVPFNVAEQLKKSVSISREVADDEEYEITIKNQSYTFPCKEVHKVISQEIEYIASMIKKCMDGCNQEYPTYINYKLTGGGLSYMRGAKEELGKYLGKHVELVKKQIPGLDMPHMASTYAVLDLALKQNKGGTGFFSRLFK